MPETRPLRVLLAGYGTVGRAFHRLVHQQATSLQERYGLDVSIVAIARSERTVADPDGLPPEEEGRLGWSTGELMDLLWEAEADVMVEATPTNLKDGQPGLAHVRTALHNELPVVLANKGPVVAAYGEVMERAEKAGVPVRFEATVAGCVPTLSAGRYSFAGDQLRKVEGILNGTTNFILTRMHEEGSDLDQALREAQSLGYAETDPTADLDGLDAAAKAVILGNALLDLELTMDDVDTTGIRGITRQAVELAGEHGLRVKLIAEVTDQGQARVSPRLVPQGSTLDVGGALNAVRFTLEAAGTVTHTGAGAGGMATAAALLSDVVDVGRWLGRPA